MKILILAAMNKELQLLSSLFDDKATEIIEGISLVCGKVGQHDVFLAQCGIGNVNAAVNAYKIVSMASWVVVVAGVAIALALLVLVRPLDRWIERKPPAGRGDG